MTLSRSIALRYLRSKKKTRFLSLSTLLSTLGILIGVAAILIVLSVMKGFEVQMKQKFVDSGLHLLIEPGNDFQKDEWGFSPKTELEKLPAIAELRRDPKVKRLEPVLLTEVVVKSGERVSALSLRSISPTTFPEFEKRLVESALPQVVVEKDGDESIRNAQIFITQTLAQSLGVIPGDTVTLISPVFMDGPFGNIPRMKSFLVGGVYENQVPEQELETAYTREKDLESFLRKEGVFQQVEVQFHDGFESLEVAEKLKAYSSLRVKTFQDLNSSLFASMRLERIAMFMILIFTVFIASLNIVSTLSLVVQEKQTEISTLRTLGARRSLIEGIFLWKGIFVGGGGVVIGTALATGLLFLLKSRDWVLLPDVYYDRTIPVSMDPWYLVGIPIFCFVLVIWVSRIPSREAGRMTPLEGLRGRD